MPYITKEKREQIGGEKGSAILPTNVECAGDLQYAIAELLNEYLRSKPDNYQTRNDIMGALAGAQMEFYRRKVIPYEDEKIKENGDV